MSEKLKQCFSMFKRRLSRRGQVAVFYALLVPMMFLLGGVGLDLGWYYLKVSRMQNAADAAVMAGAWKFLEDEGTLSDYSDAKLIDFVPSHVLKDPDTKEPVLSSRSSATGDATAKDYVKKNIADSKATWTGDTIVDGYDKDNTLKFDSNLYGRAQDWNDYGYYTMWYQVVLEEEVKHFFMPGCFEPMTARVQSVAKITHYKQGPNLYEQTDALAKSQTYLSWDHIKHKKNKGNEADNRSVLSTGNKYREGDKHRFEILRLNGKGGINRTKDEDNKQRNPYKSYGKTDQTGYDNLFVDWQTDMSKMTTEDLDVGVKDVKGTVAKSGYGGWTHFLTDTGTTALTGDENLIRRVHGTINFEPNFNGKFPYPVRDADYLASNDKAYNDMKTKQEEDNKDVFKGLTKEQIIKQISREPPDPLYVRIESEPVHDGSGYYKDPKTGVVHGSKGNNASSVRQVIINLNVANTTKYTSGENEGDYSDRPVFFYYTGPEKVSDFYASKTDNHVRDFIMTGLCL